jgi:AraC-like DNA-binding protein
MSRKLSNDEISVMAQKYIMLHPTVKDLATEAGISKTTVNNYLHAVEEFDPNLYLQIRSTIADNKARGYLLGGKNSRRYKNDKNKNRSNFSRI